MKRSVLACLAALASPLAVAADDASSSVPRFEFNEQGEFTILHITDLHVKDNVWTSWSTNVFIQAIRRTNADLIIDTGDHVYDTNWEAAIAAFAQIVKAENVPVAVTFGNHDCEARNNATQQGLYDAFKTACAPCFVDFDVPALTGVGSGKMAVYDKDASAPAWELFVMNSHALGENGSYNVWDGCYADQIAWYEQNAAANVPCLWFQHTIIPDVDETGILIPGEGGFKGLVLDTTRASGVYGEATCPPTWARYTDADHVHEGRTLYQSWLKTGNMKGAFFGHDHYNTFDGTDTNGVRFVMSGSLTVNGAPSNGNPALRVIRLKNDGTYTTELISEQSNKNRDNGKAVSK